MQSGLKQFRLYTPLYNGLVSLRIGIDEGASFQPTPQSSALPIVIWGTSIQQGAVANRPGMAYASMIARKLERNLINLGFSGNGKMQPSVAKFVAQIEAAIYIIEARLPTSRFPLPTFLTFSFVQCNMNMNADEIINATIPMVKLLRSSNPNTPIALVEEHTLANAWLLPDVAAAQQQRRAALYEQYKILITMGFTGIHFIPGAKLIGFDSEATVDGTHPTDLGMMRMCNYLYPRIQRILDAN